MFEELESSNLTLKLIKPQYITFTYFDTNLRMFDWVGLPMVAILDFQMFISQLFEELQG